MVDLGDQLLPLSRDELLILNVCVFLELAGHQPLGFHRGLQHQLLDLRVQLLHLAHLARAGQSLRAVLPPTLSRAHLLPCLQALELPGQRVWLQMPAPLSVPLSSDLRPQLYRTEDQVGTSGQSPSTVQGTQQVLEVHLGQIRCRDSAG